MAPELTAEQWRDRRREQSRKAASDQADLLMAVFYGEWDVFETK